MPMHDTRYLQELVGDALSRGCAAAVEAQPNDPVEFLGQWLLRYVKNAQIKGEFEAEKEAELQARKAALEAAAEEAAKVKAEQQVRRDAVVALSKMVDEPRELMNHAVKLIMQHTKAGAAYAAAVAETEEAAWQVPEDPEDPAANESDDEPDPSPPSTEALTEETTEAAAEQEETEQKPKVQRMVDYSKKYLSYLSASEGQDFMLKTELHRPAPPPEDADPDAKPPLTPLTFRILDERRPMIYTANTAFEPSLQFFRNFPKIGAYQACGVQLPSTGEFKAVLAVDTLFPEGSGQALSQDDQDFIWHVSRALSQAFEAMEKRAVEAVAGRNAQDLIEGLQHQITSIYHPRDQQAVEGEGAAQTPATETAQPTEEEGAAGEEGSEDPVLALKFQLKSLESQLKEAEVAKETATGALEKGQAALEAIKGILQTIGPDCLPVLRHMWHVPQATFHVLKAVLYVLGKPADSFCNWKRAFTYFTPELFQELYEYNATQDRDMDAWKAARTCYKALGEEGNKRLAQEMPESHLGVLLLMWLKQVRKVARQSVAFRTCVETEEKLHDDLDKTRVQLEEAEKRKAEEEEAARKAAEEEAAAAAAAEAAEQEGEQGEDEE